VRKGLLGVAVTAQTLGKAKPKKDGSVNQPSSTSIENSGKRLLYRLFSGFAFSFYSKSSKSISRKNKLSLLTNLYFNFFDSNEICLPSWKAGYDWSDPVVFDTNVSVVRYMPFA
jgi:hypothetical protein